MEYDMDVWVEPKGSTMERGFSAIGSVILGLDLKNFPVYRGTWLEHKPDGSDIRIALRSRCNMDRDKYTDQIKALHEHPQFIAEIEDKVENGFTTFYFEYPRELPESASQITDKGNPVDEVWWATCRDRFVREAQDTVDTTVTYLKAYEEIAGIGPEGFPKMLAEALAGLLANKSDAKILNISHENGISVVEVQLNGGED
jgi:hypothetical protein